MFMVPPSLPIKLIEAWHDANECDVIYENEQV